MIIYISFLSPFLGSFIFGISIKKYKMILIFLFKLLSLCLLTKINPFILTVNYSYIWNDFYVLFSIYHPLPLLYYYYYFIFLSFPVFYGTDQVFSTLFSLSSAGLEAINYIYIILITFSFFILYI